MARETETVTRHPFGFFNVRIWRAFTTHNSLDQPTTDSLEDRIDKTKKEVYEIYKQFINDKNLNMIPLSVDPREHIAELVLIRVSDINAIEVVDAAGDGIVIYPEWP